MARILILTAKQIASYEEDGFLIIDNFFNVNELYAFRQAYRKIIQISLQKAAKREILLSHPESFLGAEFDEGMIALEAIDHKLVADIYDISAMMPEFLRIVSKLETAAVINQLLRIESSSPLRELDSPLYAFTNRCRIDPPQDDRRTYGWHQEVFYTLPKTSFIQTWAPLIRDSTRQNGTIEVCVGSHKSGIPKQAWNEAAGRATQILVDKSVTQGYEQRIVEMRLGQMMFFSGRTFHQSGKNTSNNVRYSLVGMYHDIGVEDFRPAGIAFQYKGMTPREYFDQLSLEWLHHSSDSNA